MKAVIRCMKEAGIGYGSVNHPVDRDPVCGYNGIIDDVCPRCGRHAGEGVPLETLRGAAEEVPRCARLLLPHSLKNHRILSPTIDRRAGV